LNIEFSKSLFLVGMRQLLPVSVLL
jgi:hypothetical protein